MKILGLHHIAIAVDDLDKYNDIFKSLFDIKAGQIEINKVNNVSLSFVDLENCELEFLKPLDENSSIAKFLSKRGPGIHHICLKVENIHAAMKELETKNVKMIDETPRQGADGSLIAFIHPKSVGGILIELKQEKGNTEVSQ